MKSNQKTPFTRAVSTSLVLLLSAASAWAVSLSDFEYSGGAYLIKTGDQLNNLATYVNAGNTTKGVTFKLTANVTAAGTYIPIGNPNHVFNGTFDGNGKSIRVYYKYDPTPTKVTVGTGYSYELTAGVFGVLGSSAVVKNLTVEQPSYSLVSTKSQTGFQMSSADFGGIAGINNGQIIDCMADNNSFTVEVDATTNSVGGIVGTNKGTIKNTTSSYILTTNLKSGASNYVGGIAGYNTGTIEANTTESYITNNGGDAYIGGIVGFNAGTATKNFVSSYKKNSGSKGKGAIAGYNNKTLTQNGYYNLGTGIGTGSGDVTSSSGAIPVYKITAGTGVSVSGATTFTRYDVKYYAYNSTITLSATSGNNPKTGYTIGYSADNGNITVSSSGTFTMPAKDISVARADKPINYTITYYLNGGSNPSSAPTSYTIESAKTLPTPTRNGYSFSGWYTTSNFNGSKFTSIAKGSSGNKTFYAKWTATSYTITYYLNGGTNPSGAPTSYTAESEAITLPTPTQTGYSFAGWYTTSTFSGTKVTTISSGSSGNKNFFAKWTPNTYKVQFNANNGTDESTTQQFTYGTAKNLDLNTFNPPQGKGGFSAWTTNANGTGTSYADGQSVQNLTTTLGGTVQLYAQWKKHIAYTNDFYFYDIDDEYYTGKAIEPSVTIIKDAVDVSDDFIISYSDNINVGEATVTITIDSKKHPDYDGSITKHFKIKKAKPTITVPTATKFKYNGKAQALVTAGSTNVGFMLYSLDGTNYSDEIPTAVNAGNYTVYYKVAETENYSSVTGSVEVKIEGTYTKNEFIEINEVDGKKHVTIDGNASSDKAFEIKDDVEVEDVELTREFTFGEGYSTLVLPFEVNTNQLTGVSSILEFTGMGLNDKGIKQVEMSTLWDETKAHTKIQANKPYLIKMASATLGVVGSVTLKKTETPIATVPNSSWTFVGTYSYKEWTSDDPELGRAYGFAGQAKEGVDAGEFVKVDAGAYINPMRAYLLAPAKPAKVRAANNVTTTASIHNDYPETIEMVIVDKDKNQTTVIGTLNTHTGEFRWNKTKRTFDLKGRNVGNGNKARGAYYGKIELKK
ncbi:InlB B-repeat-containing protein [Fibrobacter sp. UWB12]|uniref:InlB B-repeat-containing protein n=1 Tax=Fibrobacter sp. UWB12 TaxID=1896203 RepID=UPI00091BFE9D|nr:InlB B-repeat-containing protein [Fibrobacter sp. UWB12]SHK98458.1 Listeria/Bacterioides repeat-containing protein [Fibrobacter sp. UWB12]